MPPKPASKAGFSPQAGLTSAASLCAPTVVHGYNSHSPAGRCSPYPKVNVSTTPQQWGWRLPIASHWLWKQRQLAQTLKYLKLGDMNPALRYCSLCFYRNKGFFFNLCCELLKCKLCSIHLQILQITYVPIGYLCCYHHILGGSPPCHS